MKAMKVVGVPAITLLVSVLAVGCGGSTSFNSGGGSTPPPAPSTPVATPAAGTYNITQTVSFNSENATSVYYTADGVTNPSCASGTSFSAPIAVAASTTFKVVGCNSAGSSSIATFAYTIAPVTVSIAPSNATLASGGTQQFAATVGNTTDTAVTWSAATATGNAGTISTNGLYTAPAVTGSPLAVVVTATSVADPTKSATASVVVDPLPTVTMSFNPSTVSAGNNTTLTIACTNAMSFAIVPVLAGAGCNSVTTVTPTATTYPAPVTYTGTATGPGGSATASATVTVTAPTPSIAVTCTPQAITTAITSQCNATYQNLSSGAAWSVVGGSANGSISASGLYTPPAVASGTLIVTIMATSTQSGYSNVSGSTTVQVTEAVPVITGSNIPSIYCDAECGIIGGVQLTGSGFQAGDTISSTLNVVSSAQVVNSGQIALTLTYDTPRTSPGFDTITIISSDGLHTTSWSIPFLGNQNLLSLSASGNIYFLDEGNSILWQYEANGTLVGNTTEGDTDSSIAADDETGYIILNQRTAGSSTFYVVGDETLGNGYAGVAVGARNGNGCMTQALGVNYLSCVNLNLSASSNPSLNSLTVGNQPWSFDMGILGTETDAFVFSRNDTILWDINVSGGMILKSSVQIPGVTPYATLQTNNPLAGGWYVNVFDSGPAAGTVAMLSTADDLLTLVNASTMTITKQVTLSGIPFRMAKDLANGVVVIAVVDQANVTTTFVSVNATTGVVTQLTSATPNGLLAAGLAISADDKSIYACQRSQCVVLPNQ